MSIEWEITKLECLPEAFNEKEFIVNAYYKCTVSKQEYTAEISSHVSFDIKKSETFINLKDLTEEIILGWIWNGFINKDYVELNLEHQINMKINLNLYEPEMIWNG